MSDPITVMATTPPRTDHRWRANIDWVTNRLTATAPETEAMIRPHGSSPRRAAAIAPPGAASRKNRVKGRAAANRCP